MRRLFVAAVMGGALAAVGLGCLNWDLQAGMKCDDGQCAAGFSCLGSYCYADGSIEEGRTCFNDVQCVDNLICPPEIFACRQPCDSADFYSRGACDADEYCRPVRGADNNWIGACQQSDACSACPIGTECTQLTSQAFACLNVCEVTFINGGVDYQDNCDHSDVDTLVRCQPVGAAGLEKTVCMEHTTNGGTNGVGEVCARVGGPCDPGLACGDGLCRPYC
ncbi:MAG: hypothetical protein AAB426_15505, partial [Myxococcota bacterium]